ncbi:uncharacterized protein KY384_004027 [Bacidia gigantensis]|uniref:uncharacterized protein n=1 Tax=Bacidia gigantensis TaxID=2732470 RepID=UPI001D03C929|nr:uncharacterized protein KY384_004027 [Bacidia gigantensis]KAG8530672.1 hypothetical protein KY384_004027 [Bacidia gigantensis]
MLSRKGIRHIWGQINGRAKEERRSDPQRKKSYPYQPLPGAEWTRLLELQPGSGPLVCGLRPAEIEGDIVQYEALSYAWGNTVDTVDIDCDGHSIPIRQNLASALVHIRHEDRPRLLWVDAVCINQVDSRERSQQVQLMGEIFASARKVLLWLGDDKDGEADQCFGLIKATNDTLQELWDRSGEVKNIPLITSEDGTLCNDSAKWDMVRQFLKSDWFSRVWVLQEVGLARTAVAFYGGTSIRWSQIIEFLLWVTLSANIRDLVGSLGSARTANVFLVMWINSHEGPSWMDEMPYARSLLGNRPKSMFLDILHAQRRYRATDPRDRVYAFLSHPLVPLHSEDGRKLISADYNQSVDQVFFDTARSLVQLDALGWTVLSAVQHRSRSGISSIRRPTWVPRWDEDSSLARLGRPSKWYMAGGHDSFQAKVSVLSPLDKWLEVKGAGFDRITWTSKVFAPEDFQWSNQVKSSPLQHAWQQLEQQGPSSVYQSSDLDQEHAFCLVSVAGMEYGKDSRRYELSRLWADHTACKDVLLSESRAVAESLTDARRADSSKSKDMLKKRALETVVLQRQALLNRRFFMTSNGYYGVCHFEVEPGDCCFVLRGANVPFVFRPASLKNQSIQRYLLVGEAYIQGVMEGEIYEELAKEGTQLTEEDIVLI